MTEISERVQFAAQSLTGADGARLLVSAANSGPTSTLGDGRHLAMRALSLEAVCTSQPYFAAPQIVTESGGSWTWEGTHCSNRFDFLQYRLIEKIGSTPSTDPSDGATVATVTVPAATYTTKSGYVYTVFADYNARGGGTVERSSDPEVGSYKVVP